MDASPLSTLPAEISNQIYLLALFEKSPIRIACYCTNGRTAYPNNTKCGVVQRTRRHLGALFLTCKQIRSETLPIFYEANSFDISLTPAEYIHKGSRPLGDDISVPIQMFAKLLSRDKPSSVKIIVNLGAYDMDDCINNMNIKRLARTLITYSRSYFSHVNGQCLLKFALIYEYWYAGSFMPQKRWIDLSLRAESINESIDTICGIMAQKWSELGVRSRIDADLTFMRSLKRENWRGGNGFKFDQAVRGDEESIFVHY